LAAKLPVFPSSPEFRQVLIVPRNTSAYVVDLCLALSPFRLAYRDLCQSGRHQCKCQPGHGHPDGHHLIGSLGHRAGPGRDEGHRRIIYKKPSFPCHFRHCHRLSWIFYFKALQAGKVSQVAPVDKLSVALTIILAVIFLGETLTLKTAIGAAFIIAGTIVMII